MDYSEISVKILAPFFYPWLSNQRIFWLYLAAALVLAAGVYFLARRRADRAAAGGLIAFLFPKKIFAHRSAWVDYRYLFINTIGFALLIAPILFGAGPVADWVAAQLQPLAGENRISGKPGWVDHFIYTLCLVLVFDGAVFLGHWLQHKVPVLWEFHKVHHSAAVLTPITVYRMHPVDDIVIGLLVSLAMGMTDGVFHTFYATSPTTLMLFNLNVFVFAFYLVGYNLRHSHVWLAYPRGLSHLLISPAQHQVHHSKDPIHYDRNFGFIFAFWDWFAGSLYLAGKREELRLGLANDEHLAFDSVWALYARPFRVLWRRYWPMGNESI